MEVIVVWHLIIVLDDGSIDGGLFIFVRTRLDDMLLRKEVDTCRVTDYFGEIAVRRHLDI